LFSLERIEKFVVEANTSLNRKYNYSHKCFYIFMKYIKTVNATNWPEKESITVKIIRLLLWFIPHPNRENEKKFHLLGEWFIEFDDDGHPVREIGIDKSGKPILASDVWDGTFGYWLDTDMIYEDFLDDESIVIDKEEFVKMWNKFRPG